MNRESRRFSGWECQVSAALLWFLWYSSRSWQQYIASSLTGQRFRDRAASFGSGFAKAHEPPAQPYIPQSLFVALSPAPEVHPVEAGAVYTRRG
jgi:hypothetical protein